MKSIFYILLIFMSVSCSMEKRRYSGGVYITHHRDFHIGSETDGNDSDDEVAKKKIEINGVEKLNENVVITDQISAHDFSVDVNDDSPVFASTINEMPKEKKILNGDFFVSKEDSLRLTKNIPAKKQVDDYQLAVKAGNLANAAKIVAWLTFFLFIISIPTSIVLAILAISKAKKIILRHDSMENYEGKDEAEYAYRLGKIVLIAMCIVILLIALSIVVFYLSLGLI